MDEKLFLTKELNIFNTRINEINALRNKIQLEIDGKDVEIKNAVNVDLFDIYDYIEKLNKNSINVVNNLNELIKANTILIEKLMYISNIYEEIKNSNYNKKVDSVKYAEYLARRATKK